MAPRAAPTPTCTKSHIPQEAAGTRFFGCSPSPCPRLHPRFERSRHLGRERENFIGMSELSGTELVLVTSFVLAASVAAFILPRRLSNVARSIIGFVIVLVGLQLLALSDDPLFGSSFDWIIESCELFSHLLMWMTFIECVRETDMPAFRISGLRSLAYVGTTMLFDRYLDDPTIATSTVIIVVVYVLFVIVLVPLAIWLRPWQSGRSDELTRRTRKAPSRRISIDRKAGRAAVTSPPALPATTASHPESPRSLSPPRRQDLRHRHGGDRALRGHGPHPHLEHLSQARRPLKGRGRRAVRGVLLKARQRAQERRPPTPRCPAERARHCTASRRPKSGTSERGHVPRLASR